MRRMYGIVGDDWYDCLSVCVLGVQQINYIKPPTREGILASEVEWLTM